MHDLIHESVLRFPELEGRPLKLEPLEKGGSDRFFFRLSGQDAPSFIVAKYGTQREENRHYVDIATFLADVGVRVPAIHLHDDQACLIWMEDLGERDLWSYRNEPWPVRRALYQSAFDQLALLHCKAHKAYETRLAHNPEDPHLPRLQSAFTEELYLWEQNYFLENCLGRVFHIDSVELAPLQPRLHAIAAELAALPRLFVHRDFQSQNIIIRDNHACLIDFQGMRYGLAQYDLASVLFDPYVTLSDSERDDLLAYYCTQARSHGAEIPAHFQHTLQLCAMQRLMQALGAYGFLGLVRERRHFLDHIPPALANLRAVAAQIDDLAPLASLLQRLKA